MNLLVIRHADAGDKTVWALTNRDDSARPLTKKGRKQTKMLARRCRFLFRDVKVIATSPLVRARETAEILHEKACPRAELLEWSELKPAVDPATTLAKVREFGGSNRAESRAQKRNQRKTLPRIAIVGHEPHLSHFLSFILTGGGDSHFSISKGGMALVEQGRLTCLLQPSQLKKIKSS